MRLTDNSTPVYSTKTKKQGGIVVSTANKKNQKHFTNIGCIHGVGFLIIRDGKILGLYEKNDKPQVFKKIHHYPLLSLPLETIDPLTAPLPCEIGRSIREEVTTSGCIQDIRLFGDFPFLCHNKIALVTVYQAILSGEPDFSDTEDVSLAGWFAPEFFLTHPHVRMGVRQIIRQFIHNAQ